jgi:hypothetical protein
MPRRRFPELPVAIPPSAICALIKREAPKGQVEMWAGRHSTQNWLVFGLLEVVPHLDMRLLSQSLSSEQLLEWHITIADLRLHAVRVRRSISEGVWFHGSTVKRLHDLLALCPDTVEPQAESALSFIADPLLRRSVARDIDSLEVLLHDEEWKAATVIGGSIAEALLLAKLLEEPNATRAKELEAQHVQARKDGWRNKRPFDKWDLWKLVAVALELGLIDDKVAGACDGAREFRNLIHPGVERASAPCDKGTALLARAVVENLVAVFSGERQAGKA